MSQKTNHIATMGFVAGGTISANRLVKWDTTDGQVVHATAGDPVLGVALHSASSGEQVDVCLFGLCDVEASAAISQNAVVGATTAGKAVAISTGTSSADNDLAGTAFEAATADGDLITIFIGKNPMVTNA